MLAEMEAIFLLTKDRISQDFFSERTTDLLHSVSFTIVDQYAMSESLQKECYKLKSRVPAYYNPNNHTVYLNKDILSPHSQSIIENICYHELVHAISFHRSWREGSHAYYQSGLKLEVFTSDYQCKYRSLNEGVVQYLTNTNLQSSEQAYKNEVILVNELVRVLGLGVVQTALLDGDITTLAQAFNDFFPETDFDTFSSNLDQKEYKKASLDLKSHHYLVNTPVRDSVAVLS